MDRMRTIVVAGLALLLALIAGIGTYRFLAEKGKAAEAARLETVGIAVAAVEIPLGATINPNQVQIGAWPRSSYPKDSFSDAKPLAGRVARREFLRGEPIVESKLVPANKTGGILALKIPVGMRAFSVKVNEVVGVGGFLVPDARVDVVCTTAPSAQRQQEQVSKIVLEDVLVLAAGQVIEQKDNKPVTVNTVTLAVSPDDTEKLALASNDGKIQLVLRNFADGEKIPTGGVDKGRLLASYRNLPAPAAPSDAQKRKPAARRKASPPARVAAAPPPPPAPAQAFPVPPPVAKAAYTVEVIRGNKRAEEKLD